MAIVIFLGIILAILTFSPNHFNLSKIFRALKVFTAIGVIVPILAIAWFVFDPPQIEDAAYLGDALIIMLSMSIACIGGLVLAWLVGYAYWLYAKKMNLFEISSPQLAIMLLVAIVGWFATAYLVPLILFGNRF